jgi:hypothetical protein
VMRVKSGAETPTGSAISMPVYASTLCIVTLFVLAEMVTIRWLALPARLSHAGARSRKVADFPSRNWPVPNLHLLLKCRRRNGAHRINVDPGQSFMHLCDQRRKGRAEFMVLRWSM